MTARASRDRPHRRVIGEMESLGHHGKQLPFVCDAFEGVRSSASEVDLRSAHELLDSRSDEHFTRLGQGGDPCADMHRDAGGLGSLAFDLAGVQTGTDLQADLPDRIADSASATDGPRGPVEGREEAVASGVDLGSAIMPQELADSGVMAVEKLPPTVVADRLELLGGTDNVGEQHGGKHAVRCRGKPYSGDEGLDLGEDLSDGWPGEERVSVPWELNEAGTRDAGSKVAGRLDAGDRIAGPAHHQHGDANAWQDVAHIYQVEHAFEGRQGRRAGRRLRITHEEPDVSQILWNAGTRPCQVFKC